MPSLLPRRSSPFVLPGALVLLGLGCGSEGGGGLPSMEEPSAQDAGAPKESDSAVPDAAATVPPCDARETAALQGALDSSHSDSTDAVAAIKTPSCGVRFFSSGPSKVDASKLHRIASITKTYVGSVILKLAEEGLVPLDAPASKWLPDIPEGDTILVRHLLQHTSGLAKYDTTPEYLLGVGTRRVWTPQEELELAFRQDLVFAPGSQFTYTNTNFVALGTIAERATGKSLATLVRERILVPVGVHATFFDGGEPIVGELAEGKGPLGTNATHFFEPSALWGDGNIVATPADTLRWIEALGSGSFHSPATDQAMKTIYPGSESVGYGYGLAFMELPAARSFGGGLGYGHGGNIPGYHSMAFYFPASKATVVTIIDFDPPDEGEEPYRIVFDAVLKALFAGK